MVDDIVFGFIEGFEGRCVEGKFDLLDFNLGFVLNWYVIRLRIVVVLYVDYDSVGFKGDVDFGRFEESIVDVLGVNIKVGELI